MNRILTLYIFLLLCGTVAAQRTVEWNDLQTLTDDARRTVYYKKDSKRPLQGKYRIIRGLDEEHVKLSDGMINGNYRRYRDGVLSEIGCGFVLVDRREWETADSVYVSLVMPYYSHGIVDAGTSKSFVYDPGLRSRRNIRIAEHGDLNEIYRRTYNDTTLYKPVKEGWYIELDHSR